MKKFLSLLLLLGVFGVINVFPQEEVSLSYKHMFYAYFNGMKKTPDDTEIDAYIENVYPNEYHNYRNNEFEWRKLRQEKAQELNSGIANFSYDTLFVVLSEPKFGEYNFDKEGFTIEIGNKLSFNLMFNRRYNSFNLILTNIKEFNLMKIEPDNANALIKSRTRLLGDVDRSVRIKIYFKFSDFTQEVFTSLIKELNGYNIHGKVELIDAIDSPTSVTSLN